MTVSRHQQSNGTNKPTTGVEDSISKLYSYAVGDGSAMLSITPRKSPNDSDSTNKFDSITNTQKPKGQSYITLLATVNASVNILSVFP